MKWLLIHAFLFVQTYALSQEQPALSVSVETESHQLCEWTFPDELDSLKQYLNSHLIYPEYAIENGLEGTCIVTFSISDSGFITSVSIKKGVLDCRECDQEVIRVFRSMPCYKPYDSEDDICVSYALPIGFFQTDHAKILFRSKQ